MTRKIVQEERRAQILEALNRCLLEKPFRDTTIKDIAREAGVTHGVLHYYFESKQDILLNFLDYKIESYLSREAEWFSAENLDRIPPAEILRETLRFNRDLILKNKDDIRIIIEFFGLANHDGAVREKLREAAARIEGLEQGIVRRAGLDEAAAVLLSRSIFAQFVGLGLFSTVLGYDDRAIEEVIDRFRLLLDLLARPTR